MASPPPLPRSGTTAPPSPPRSASSVSPKLPSQILASAAASSSSSSGGHPSKKQKRDTPPLTPDYLDSSFLPRSISPCSSATLSAPSASPPPLASSRTSFASLPVELQENIIRLAAWNSPWQLRGLPVTLFADVNVSGHYAMPDTVDCRFSNTNLALMLYMRGVLARWRSISRVFNRVCHNMLLEHCVVTSAAELWAVAGVRWDVVEEAEDRLRTLGKTEGKRAEEPEEEPSEEELLNKHSIAERRSWLECDTDPRPAPRPFAPRRRVRVGQKRFAPDLILWMARTPEDLGRAPLPEEDRWPKWYLNDGMRHELAELGVERLTIVAPHQATVANALNATIPNCSQIKHLRIEILHASGPIFSSSPRFFPAYTHQPISDHLCPRLTLHAPHLRSLALRNVHVCAELVGVRYPQLKELLVSFPLALAGLCLTQPTWAGWDWYEWSAWKERVTYIASDFQFWLDLWGKAHPATHTDVRLCREFWDGQRIQLCAPRLAGRERGAGWSMADLREWEWVRRGLVWPDHVHAPSQVEETDYDEWTDGEEALAEFDDEEEEEDDDADPELERVVVQKDRGLGGLKWGG